MSLLQLVRPIHSPPPAATSQPRLVARELTLGYPGRGTSPDIVQSVTLAVPDRAVTVIVGANACGKSTLLRGLARLLRPRGGAVHLDDRELSKWSSREVATRLALLPQSPSVPEGVSVAELVSRGRHPHRRVFSRACSADAAAVTRALEATGTMALADRSVADLSGGQRQRVWLALALAQETDLLLLDEPTTYLDVAHQVDVLELLAELNHTRNTTVVMVLHDLNLAARYADHLVALKGGRVLAEGPPAEVVTADLVHQVFGLKCRVITDPETGTPLVVPLARAHHPAHSQEKS